jgi:peptide subunit release factor 1 (eRF1)
MNTLDIVLTNTISYMLGIFKGMFVSYYVKGKDKEYKKDNDIKEKEYDDNTDKYTSPIQTAMAYPSAPPTPLALNPCANPEYPGNKKITITTE